MNENIPPDPGMTEKVSKRELKQDRKTRRALRRGVMADEIVRPFKSNRDGGVVVTLTEQEWAQIAYPTFSPEAALKAWREMRPEK